MLLFRIVTVGVILLGCYGLIHEQTAALDANVLQIAIMGMTGVGKSSFINALGGLHVKDNSSASVCDGFESCKFV
jgi:predicted GTPase